MDLLTTKIVTLILFGTIRSLCGVAPLFVVRKMTTWSQGGDIDLQKSKKRKRVVELVTSCLLCLGGGVLMSTCFLHLLPEVRHSLDRVKWENGLREFNMAEFIVCCGFLLIYFIEEVVHSCHSVHRHRKKKRRKGKEEVLASTLRLEKNNYGSVVSVIDPDAWSSCTPKDTSSESTLYSSATPDSESQQYSITTPDSDVVLTKEGHSHHHIDGLSDDTIFQSLRSLLFVVAISFHAVFEGMTIGFQETPTDVWYIFAAISMHDYVMAFIIGLELMETRTRMSMFIAYTIVMSLMTPIGISIGIVVSEELTVLSDTHHALMMAVLQGLGAGTILYVTFFEILERERQREGYALPRFLLVVLGVTIMAVLEGVGGHSHDAGGGGGGGHHEDHHHHHHHHHTHHGGHDINVVTLNP